MGVAWERVRNSNSQALPTDLLNYELWGPFHSGAHDIQARLLLCLGFSHVTWKSLFLGHQASFELSYS